MCFKGVHCFNLYELPFVIYFPSCINLFPALHAFQLFQLSNERKPDELIITRLLRYQNALKSFLRVRSHHALLEFINFSPNMRSRKKTERKKITNSKIITEHTHALFAVGSGGKRRTPWSMIKRNLI